MQVKSIAECSPWSFLQYFRPSLSYNLPLRPLFCLFFEWPLKTGFTVWFSSFKKMKSLHICTNLWNVHHLFIFILSSTPLKNEKILSNVPKVEGAHLRCVKNHYAKLEYKGTQTAGVTITHNIWASGFRKRCLKMLKDEQTKRGQSQWFTTTCSSPISWKKQLSSFMGTQDNIYIFSP